jgi:hypothetical protein
MDARVGFVPLPILIVLSLVLTLTASRSELPSHLSPMIELLDICSSIGSAERSQLSGVFHCLDPDLYSAGVLLPECQSVPCGNRRDLAIGQVSEVMFMLLLPLFIHRFGIKTALLMGMLAWALRYVLFAYGNNADLAFVLFIGIAQHGVCYDFFFVSGQIYTDAKTPEHFRSTAQGLITLATYGFGMLIGFWVVGHVSDY